MKKKKLQQPIYLNTAAVGKLSEASVAAVRSLQQQFISNPAKAFMGWMENDLPSLRARFSDMLNADENEIAFVPNFTYALLGVINSLPADVKKVLLYRDDYPSLTMPFQLNRFDVVYVESDSNYSISLEELMETALREKVQCIAISHVQFLTGFTIDIKTLSAFCDEHGILLIIDATQSMGAVEINFGQLRADVLISSSYKWLNGGSGSAVMAIRKSFLDRYPARFAGFGSMSHDGDEWRYSPSNLSYEGGHLNAFGLLHLQKAVEQRMTETVAAVQNHNSRLIDRLIARLDGTRFGVPLNREEISTMVCFEARKDIFELLQQKNISVTYRKGLLRVSPHFYNSESEIDVFCRILKEAPERAGQ